ncbi:MAG: pantoate--beta-alanine ligase [Bacteroidota bacterium]
MKVFHRAADLQEYLRKRRTNNRSVGFVPTMGALHQGHLALVERSREENQLTIVSIFVNPTQFNDPEDLQKYPRSPGKDIELLAGVGCEVVFLPVVAEVYPSVAKETNPPLDFNGLDTVLEGEMRPGHFAGVADVVERLLRLTKPDRLYLGQKDYQQVAIVRSMIRQRNLPVEVCMAPIVRAKDGLALSSRNQRLQPEYRSHASNIYKHLNLLKVNLLNKGKNQTGLIRKTLDVLSEVPGCRPEYLSVIDPDSLEPLIDGSPVTGAVIVTAVWVGDVRLIDNVIVQ